MSFLKHKSARWLVGFLFSMFILSVVGIIYLKSNNQLGEHGFGREVGKTLLDIFAVSVIGTIATLLLTLYSQDHDRREKDNERKRIEIENRVQFKKDILKRFNEVYADIKATRRMLRARGFTTPYYRNWDKNANVVLTVYDDYMKDINKAQLRIEIIAKEILANKNSFKDVKIILKYMLPLKSAVKKIVREYEVKRSLFKGEPPVLPINQLEQLETLVGSSKSGDFAIKFFTGNDKIISILMNEILSFKEEGSKD